MSLLLTLAPARSAAQSTISATDRHAYAANAGWIDFRPGEADGVRITDSFLSGYAYAANFGWIHFGDSTPENGYAYSNASDTDFGVNLTATGELSGSAYAANVGWINFEQDHGLPTLDFVTGRLSGFAHSANLGWIALATPSSALATATLPCPDTDGDSIGDAFEWRYFDNLATAGSTTDSDADGHSDLDEFTEGTDPTRAGSHLSIAAYTLDPITSTLELYFTSVRNRLYRIEYDDDLVGIWTDSDAGLITPSASDTTFILINFPATDHRFFRVIAVKPLQP